MHACSNGCSSHLPQALRVLADAAVGLLQVGLADVQARKVECQSTDANVGRRDVLLLLQRGGGRHGWQRGCCR